MPIKVWDYLQEYADEKKDINLSIENVMNSGRLILGENVCRFENEFADYCGVKYGVGVNSGTDALFVALKALGIKSGDEVITVSNTAVPTVSAIVSAGAIPKFVDVDVNTYLMDTTQLESVITEKTKCILPVHLFGQCVKMDEVKIIARKYGLFVLEDCAQSHGALYYGNKAGSLSDIAAFSFYPTKILGGFGDGGMVITENEELYRKIKRLRFYGMENRYYSVEHGYNTRLDELHAAILRTKLKRIDKYILRRKEIAARYDEALKDSGLILPKVAEYNSHAYYLYVVRHVKRDIIIEELKKNDIDVNISYPWPIHIMEAYTYLDYKEGDLPNTELLAKEIFSLPMYPSLTGPEQTYVIDSLLNILSRL